LKTQRIAETTVPFPGASAVNSGLILSLLELALGLCSQQAVSTVKWIVGVGKATFRIDRFAGEHTYQTRRNPLWG
jgi:hypothetical protein